MPVIVSKSPPIIRLSGADLEPPDGSLARVGRRDREDYWRQVAKEAYDAVLKQIRSGKDIHGNKPKRKRPRRDSARGPFFSPHHSLSRVQTQLRYFQVGGKEAVVVWKKPWSKIVSYWAAGVRGRVYDLVGLTAENVERIKDRVWKWWHAKVSKGRLGLAGVTMVGPAPARPIVWRQEFGAGPLPPRPAVFAGLAPAAPPAVVRAPEIRPRQPAFAIVQQVQPLYEAAGVRRTTLAEINRVVNRLETTQTSATLAEVAWRLGVVPVPTGKPEAVRAIRAVLEDRLRTGRAGGSGPKPRPVRVPPPPPPPIVSPEPASEPAPPAEPSWLSARRERVRSRLAEMRPAVEAVRAKEDELVKVRVTIADLRRRLVEMGPYNIAARRPLEAELIALEDRRSLLASLPEDRRMKAEFRRLEAWQTTVEDVPNLIPPGPIAGRIAEYGRSGGDAKVKALIDFGDRFEAERAALQARASQLSDEAVGKVRQIDRLTSEWMASSGRRKKDLKAQIDQLANDVEESKRERTKLRNEMNSQQRRMRIGLADLLAVDKPTEVRVDDHPGLDTRTGQKLDPLAVVNRANADDAARWLGKVLHRGDTPQIAPKIGQSRPREDGRAHQNSSSRGGERPWGYIKIKPDEDPAVILHELGHAVDEFARLGGERVVERSREFLDYRCAGETARPMREVAPSGGYDADEEGRKDGFDSVWEESEAYYVGKKYSDATEVISMSLQMLYNDPTRLAKNDPELCKFILGILDGSLR